MSNSSEDVLREAANGSAKAALASSPRTRLRALLVPTFVAAAVTLAIPTQPASADAPAGSRATGETTTVSIAMPGQCTDGALQKWFEASGSYPVLHGNAKDWPDSAQADGWTVVNVPQSRSLVVFQPGVQGASGLGHVAWVNSTSQRPDGVYLNITEMNNAQHGGVGAWWTRDVRDVPGMSFILLP